MILWSGEYAGYRPASFLVDWAGSLAAILNEAVMCMTTLASFGHKQLTVTWQRNRSPSPQPSGPGATKPQRPPLAKSATSQARLVGVELEELPAAQPQVSLEVLVEIFFGVGILVWVWLGFWECHDFG